MNKPIALITGDQANESDTEEIKKVVDPKNEKQEAIEPTIKAKNDEQEEVNLS